MAPVTGLNELFARDEIRKSASRGRFIDARDVFLRHVLKIDAGRVGIPNNPIYSQACAMAHRQIEGLISLRRQHAAQVRG